MDPSLLRQLWSLVETAQVSFIMSLDDNGLVHWLLGQLASASIADTSKSPDLDDYIRSKLPLIRDIAQNK
ncbi:MAG: hypothetical protein F6J97_07315 [Leptolyngbya sp. SIO4C1]|nr:hypothetical protein [Leptolyngbya sp. SIO4C1]